MDRGAVGPVVQECAEVGGIRRMDGFTWQTEYSETIFFFGSDRFFKVEQTDSG